MILAQQMEVINMKFDPVTYYDYEAYEDDDCASSKDLKAAFDHLHTDTPEEIFKSISLHVDECEDELPNDFNDKCLPSFSSFYQGTVKPYTQNKRMEAFINASKMEIISPEEAIDFNKLSIIHQYQYLVQLGIRFCMIHNLPHMYCKTGGIYHILESTGTGYFLIYKELPPELQRTVNPDSLVKLIKNLPAIDGIEQRNALNSNQSPYLINFKDGIYNILSGEIIPHSPEFTFLSYINASVRDVCKKDNDDLFFKFLYNSFGLDGENLSNFQEMCGLAFSTIRNLKIAFFLYGPSNCGKTAIQNTLRRFVGDEFCSSLTFSQINEKFAVAGIVGKSLNLGGEITTVTANSVDKFKSVVGNDTIHVERKGVDGFDTVNYALITFSCNNLPQLKHHDEAFYSRIRIIRYTKSLDKAERINNIDGRIYEEARGAFLRFAIIGLKRFIENGYELSYIKKSNYYVTEYMNNANSFSAFASEYIKPAPGEFLLSSEITAAYTDYCKKFSLGKPLYANVWSGILKSLFNVEDSRSAKARGYENLCCTYFTDAEKRKENIND